VHIGARPTPAHGHTSAVQLALVLYAAYNVAATVASIPAGRLIDHRGAVLVLTVGVAGFGLAFVGFALTGASIAILAVCFVVAGVAIGCVETAEHAAVASLAPENIRGSAFGCWQPSRASATSPPAPSPGSSGRSSPQ
jgi:MFS family permease